MPSKSAQKKTEPVVVVDAAAPAPDAKKSKAKVVPVVDGAAVVVTKKEPKSRVKKVAAPLAVVDGTFVDAPAVDEQNTVVPAADTLVADEFAEFVAKFDALLKSIPKLKSELKTLEKHVAKQGKVVEKFQNKKKRKGTRAPSGFVKPSPISDELAKFLGKPIGTEMARTDVTKEINMYIREKALQDPDNGRIIRADAALSALLKLGDEEPSVELTYFNLQRYMSPHFPKQPKQVAPVAAVVA
jgi:hypothetical protein